MAEKRVRLTVVSLDGTCHKGHKPGDAFVVDCYDAGGVCGYLYHAVFPFLSVLQYGGSYPWAPDGRMRLPCPDAYDRLVVETEVVDG